MTLCFVLQPLATLHLWTYPATKRCSLPYWMRKLTANGRAPIDPISAVSHPESLADVVDTPE